MVFLAFVIRSRRPEIQSFIGSRLVKDADETTGEIEDKAVQVPAIVADAQQPRLHGANRLCDSSRPAISSVNSHATQPGSLERMHRLVLSTVREIVWGADEVPTEDAA
ncbi:MAG: hypothetical protein JO270_03420 [Acidobacteriaceae bacterium]|nr:hypothetical protein [Acidobacteriaceae bacterium]